MFSLPFIGLTSPFSFAGSMIPNQGSAHSDQRIPSTDGSVADSTTEGEDDREMPFTPPQPAYMADRLGHGHGANKGNSGPSKDDSPHRLPSLEFEQGEFTVSLPVAASARASPSEPLGLATPTKASAPAGSYIAQPLNDQTALASSTSDFGAARPTSPSSVASGQRGQTQGSTTTRVRQRISREMIRSTIEQRIADGSLSRRGSVPVRPGSAADASNGGGVPSALARQAREAREAREAKHQSMPLALLTSSTVAATRATPSKIPLPTRVTSISKAKDNHTTPTKGQDAPPPLPPKLSTGTPMAKSHTDGPNQTPTRTQDRPAMRPRSQTQSASEVLKKSERDGKIAEPQSALDKLVATLGPDEKGKTRAASGARGMGRSVSAASVLSQAGDKPLKGILQRPSNGDLRSASHSQVQGHRAAQQGDGEGKEKEKGRRASRRRSRRSLSTGDVVEESREARSRDKEREGKDGKREKRDRKTRLTLGLEEREGAGWAKEMQEEAERIGVSLVGVLIETGLIVDSAVTRSATRRRRLLRMATLWPLLSKTWARPRGHYQWVRALSCPFWRV